MNKIAEIAHDVDSVKVDRATKVHEEILVRTILTASNLIELGKLFKEIRDEKLYTQLGADSFREYCAYPEIPYARATIYSFIGIYEKFVLRLGFPPEILAQVGHWKLQLINPVCKSDNLIDAQLWIEKSKTLSPSDLINEIRSEQGKPEMLPAPKEEENEKYYKFNKTGWVEFVGKCPCIIHPHRGVSESAHFPRTKKRGAEYWEVIPLCHECHDEAHRDTYDFLWLNRVKIFKWFFKLLIGGKE